MNEVIERVIDANPDAMLVNGFDDALIGVGHRAGRGLSPFTTYPNASQF